MNISDLHTHIKGVLRLHMLAEKVDWSNIGSCVSQTFCKNYILVFLAFAYIDDIKELS